MDGSYSSLLNDIRQHVKNGGNVTHILNVKISNQQSAEEGARIHQMIFRAINNISIAKMVGPMNVSITWRTSALQTSTYYHCDVGGLLGDVAVKEHTKLLLRDLLTSLDAQLNNIFTNGVTGVSFLVTKPLARAAVLVEDNVPPPEQQITHDDELDETEENY